MGLLDLIVFMTSTMSIMTQAFPWFRNIPATSVIQDNVDVHIFLHEGHGRFGRSTRDAGLPSDLQLQFQLHGENVNIRMKRSLPFVMNKDGKRSIPDFPVFVIEDGHIKRKQIIKQHGLGFYANESTGSSFVVRRASNRAEFIMEGIFYQGLQQLHISPDLTGSRHRVHKQNMVVDFREDYVDSPEKEYAKRTSNDKVQEGTKSKVTSALINERASHGKPINQSKHHVVKKRQAGDEHEVQLFMVADYKDYRTWLKYYGYNSTLTELEMNLYYAFIANSMSVRYSSVVLVDPSFRLDIIISGLLIVNSQSVSYWTEDYTLRPGSHYVDASNALDSFRHWVKSARFDLPNSDHWMLFTGFDIYTDRNPNVAGLAKLGGMCSLSSVSIIEQDNTGSVGATAAHELGHSLGALHDGEEKSCYDEDNYVMSRKLKTPDDEHLASRPWQFSPCSVQAFKRFVSQTKCTHRSSVGMSVLSTKLSPGQVFSADLQCQLALGNGSYFGRSLQIREGYPSMCRRLYCAVPGEPGLYQAIFAMEKTSCGDGKWCQQGKCVDHREAPHMEDMCPQGDDPTAPCSREDCPYYTVRTRTVYCCTTCHNVMTSWFGLLTGRASQGQIVRQIEAEPVLTSTTGPASVSTKATSSAPATTTPQLSASKEQSADVGPALEGVTFPSFETTTASVISNTKSESHSSRDDIVSSQTTSLAINLEQTSTLSPDTTSSLHPQSNFTTQTVENVNVTGIITTGYSATTTKEEIETTKITEDDKSHPFKTTQILTLSKDVDTRTSLSTLSSYIPKHVLVPTSSTLLPMTTEETRFSSTPTISLMQSKPTESQTTPKTSIATAPTSNLSKPMLTESKSTLITPKLTASIRKTAMLPYTTTSSVLLSLPEAARNSDGQSINALRKPDQDVVKYSDIKKHTISDILSGKSGAKISDMNIGFTQSDSKSPLQENANSLGLGSNDDTQTSQVIPQDVQLKLTSNALYKDGVTTRDNNASAPGHSTSTNVSEEKSILFSGNLPSHLSPTLPPSFSSASLLSPSIFESSSVSTSFSLLSLPSVSASTTPPRASSSTTLSPSLSSSLTPSPSSSTLPIYLLSLSSSSSSLSSSASSSSSSASPYPYKRPSSPSPPPSKSTYVSSPFLVSTQSPNRDDERQDPVITLGTQTMTSPFSYTTTSMDILDPVLKQQTDSNSQHFRENNVTSKDNSTTSPRDVSVESIPQIKRTLAKFNHSLLSEGITSSAVFEEINVSDRTLNKSRSLHNSIGTLNETNLGTDLPQNSVIAANSQKHTNISPVIDLILKATKNLEHVTEKNAHFKDNSNGSIDNEGEQMTGTPVLYVPSVADEIGNDSSNKESNFTISHTTHQGPEKQFTTAGMREPPSLRDILLYTTPSPSITIALSQATSERSQLALEADKSTALLASVTHKSTPSKILPSTEWISTTTDQPKQRSTAPKVNINDQNGLDDLTGKRLINTHNIAYHFPSEVTDRPVTKSTAVSQLTRTMTQYYNNHIIDGMQSPKQSSRTFTKNPNENILPLDDRYDILYNPNAGKELQPQESKKHIPDKNSLTLNDLYRLGIVLDYGIDLSSVSPLFGENFNNMDNSRNMAQNDQPWSYLLHPGSGAVPFSPDTFSSAPLKSDTGTSLDRMSPQSETSPTMDADRVAGIFSQLLNAAMSQAPSEGNTNDPLAADINGNNMGKMEMPVNSNALLSSRAGVIPLGVTGLIPTVGKNGLESPPKMYQNKTPVMQGLSPLSLGPGQLFTLGEPDRHRYGVLFDTTRQRERYGMSWVPPSLNNAAPIPRLSQMYGLNDAVNTPHRIDPRFTRERGLSKMDDFLNQMRSLNRRKGRPTAVRPHSPSRRQNRKGNMEEFARGFDHSLSVNVNIDDITPSVLHGKSRNHRNDQNSISLNASSGANNFNGSDEIIPQVGNKSHNYSTTSCEESPTNCRSSDTIIKLPMETTDNETSITNISNFDDNDVKQSVGFNSDQNRADHIFNDSSDYSAHNKEEAPPRYENSAPSPNMNSLLSRNPLASGSTRSKCRFSCVYYRESMSPNRHDYMLTRLRRLLMSKEAPNSADMRRRAMEEFIRQRAIGR